MSEGQQERDSYPRSYGWLGCSLAIWGLIALAGAAMALWGNLHGNDFKHIYLGMQALTEGEEPYSPQSLLLQASRHGLRDASLNPFVYLPFTGLSLGFLKPLSFEAASRVWFAINILCTLGACLLIAKGTLLNWVDREQWFLHVAGGALLLAAFMHPLSRTLTAGQLNCVLLLALSGALAAIVAGRWALAGAVLGFAAMFKIAPAIFLFYFLGRRRWCALLTMAATMAVLGIISVIAVGWEVHAQFLPMLRDMGYGRSTWQEHGATFWKDPPNQSLNSLLTHLAVASNGVTTAWVNGTQAWANRMTMVLTVILLLAYVLTTALPWSRRKSAMPEPSESDIQTFHLTTLVMLLVPSLLWDHYLVLALPALVYLIVNGMVNCRRGDAWIAFGCWALMAVPWKFDAVSFRSGPAILLMSMKLFPLLALTALLFVRSWGQDRRKADHGPVPGN